MLYGQRDEPYVVLSQLGRRLETVLESEAVLPAIVDTVREALRVPYVALEVQSADGERIAAESGARSPVALRIALPHQSERIGSLLVAVRAPGEALGPADQQLLEDVARQAGTAVHAVGLTSELQGARERLVAAREEERRRLRRDLHDGFGPRLASLGLQLAALRNTLAADPELQERVESLKRQTQEAVDDVRQLVDGLRPPALDELGLVGAVEQFAFRYSGHACGVQVCVEVPTALPALPAAVEVAAYRIITETLTNVVRHAQATSCQVRVGVGGDSLDVDVLDDGRGLRSADHAGTGLLSMRERAEELGGTLLIESVPAGGTCIRAHLPVGKPSA
jgi:two-component system NarL family sensor kinase